MRDHDDAPARVSGSEFLQARQIARKAFLRTLATRRLDGSRRIAHVVGIRMAKCWLELEQFVGMLVQRHHAAAGKPAV